MEPSEEVAHMLRRIPRIIRVRDYVQDIVRAAAKVKAGGEEVPDVGLVSQRQMLSLGRQLDVVTVNDGNHAELAALLEAYGVRRSEVPVADGLVMVTFEQKNSALVEAALKAMAERLLDVREATEGEWIAATFDSLSRDGAEKAPGAWLGMAERQAAGPLGAPTQGVGIRELIGQAAASAEQKNSALAAAARAASRVLTR